MPLRIRCPSGHKLIVPDDRAGRSLRCPRCGQVTQVPAEDSGHSASLSRTVESPALRQEAGETAEASAVSRPTGASSSVLDWPNSIAAPTTVATPPEPDAAPSELAAEAPLPPREPSPRPKPTAARSPVKPKSRALPLSSPASVPAAAPVVAEAPPRQPAGESRHPETIAEPPVIAQPPAVAGLEVGPSSETRTEGAPAVEQPVQGEADGKLAVTEVVAGAEPAETYVEEAVEVAAPPVAADSPAAIPAAAAQPLGADRGNVWAAYQLAAAVVLTALFSIAPAIWDVVEYVQFPEGQFIARWALALFLLGLVQVAYAAFLVQLPDWSTVWVVTVYSLVLAAIYAAVLGLALLSHEEGLVVTALQLADKLAGGKAVLWCLSMVSVSTILAFFAGRLSARWHRTEGTLRGAGL